MTQTNSLKIVEVCRVTPHQGSSPADKYSLPLTFFDLIWLRFAPIERVFFFETSSSSSSTSTDAILHKLKTSLSHTFQHFLPLAGNLIWPQQYPTLVIRYAKGDAVLFTVAEYLKPEDFHHLSNSDFVQAEKYHPLVPKLEPSAALAIQITLFPNYGFSIGTAMHHAVMDGKSYTSFVKSWAHICKHGSTNLSLPENLKPLYDRSVVKDPTGLGKLYSTQYLDQDGPKNRSVTPSFFIKDVKPDCIRGAFELTRAKIQTLRDHVTTAMSSSVDSSSSSSLHLSTFSLTCAYCWVCSVKAQEINAGKTAMGFAVDARARLDPPIPENYFGNCVASCIAVAETRGLLSEHGLVVALSAITEAIRRLDDKGVLNGAESWVSNFLEFSLYEMLLSVAGSQRFEIYETDFGWGKPKRTEVVSIDKTGAMSLSASKNGGGAVEVGLVLKKQHMEAFASLFASPI